MKESDSISVDGLLGLKVIEFANPCIFRIYEQTTLYDASRLMYIHGIRHLPIMKGDNVVGIISDRDIAVALGSSRATKTPVGDVMQKSPYIVDANTELEEVIDVMLTNKYGSMLVTGRQGRYLGILTTTDVLRAFLDVLRGDMPQVNIEYEGISMEYSDEEGMQLSELDLESDLLSANLDFD